MSSHIEKEVSPPFNGHFFKKYFNISKYNTMQLEAVFPSYTDFDLAAFFLSMTLILT